MLNNLAYHKAAAGQALFIEKLRPVVTTALFSLLWVVCVYAIRNRYQYTNSENYSWWVIFLGLLVFL